MPKVSDEGPRTGDKNEFDQMNQTEWVPYFPLMREAKPASKISFSNQKKGKRLFYAGRGGP
jgi:hypothetical protein